MENASKIFIALALLSVALLTFGCVGAVSDKDALTQFSALQDKYSAKDALPTNQIALNDYISRLSTLRGETIGSPSKIIGAELYSAQTFYYLNDSLSTFSAIDVSSMKCQSTDVKNITNSVNLAGENYTNAVNAINSLSTEELKSLRPGMLDMVKGFGEKISQIKAYFENKC